MRRLVLLSLILLAGCSYTTTEKATTSLLPRHPIGPARGLVHDPTVVIVGDSVITAWLTPGVLAANPLWTAQTSPAGMEETSAEILARFPAALALHSDLIILEAGVWDMDPPGQQDSMCMVTAATTAPTPCQNIASMVEEARAAGVYVIVCTIPPWGIGPMASEIDDSGIRGLNINSFNFNLETAYGPVFDEQPVAGAALADFYGTLAGQNEDWVELGPESDPLIYLPAYTSDGIDPGQAGGQIMTRTVQALITASHVGGAR
jgi:hypothetical protein